ncbi:hypothetical protein ABID21_004649 [Pseudorhizobium tarimense]|uniref:Uncharacterized protein n=1 Tax=Pseudorhizobium tarimense TaxID=1079109 RepID=A0ABV2HD91_9HYPH|nr:hypothetical protein [Pseudorhizobium tarimense]MCJ8521516.1 hypothetical protein [Pseudorhizobium tarimense]
MSEGMSKELKAAIRHRISCLDKPTLNSFAGTGRSQKRESGAIHIITREIIGKALVSFAFHWNFGNFEPAGETDVYLTVLTAIFDIDDEDARRWTDRAEWDAARDEAVREIVQALERKFVIRKRRIVTYGAHPGPEKFGSPGGAHNLMSKFEDEI